MGLSVNVAGIHAILTAILLGCQTHPVEPRLHFRSNAIQHASSIFTTYCTTPDIQAAHDVANELAAQLPRLRNDLKYDYRHPVSVEIYPDQATYDAHLMDPSVRGSPACSGHRTIQMVSPRYPMRIASIPYSGRLGMAVHELAHLFLNEINGEMPIWLQEGVASFEGGADGYHAICRIPEVARILRNPPSLSALKSSYGSVPAGDVISFTFIDFVVTTKGIEALNLLIRNPAGFEEALALPERDVEIRWRDLDALGHVNNAVFLTFADSFIRADISTNRFGALVTG